MTASIDPRILVFLVFFFAVFTQSAAGFGVALVSMAFLPALVGIQVATPLVAVVAVVLEFFLLMRYRSALNLQALWRIILASVAGIPLGIWAFGQVSEAVVIRVLGVILAGYALYGLFDFRLPALAHQGWAYATGLVAGMLGGAYNVSGPPVILYGNCRRWAPAEFKSNLQGFFFINSVFVVIGHAIGSNLTRPVWVAFLYALPAVALGIWGGTRLDGRIDAVTFRKIVLVLLIVMGVRMLVFG